MRDLDAEVAYRKAKRKWQVSQARARRLGYLGGLSVESIRLYREYLDAYSAFIHSGDNLPLRPKMTIDRRYL